MRNWARVTTRVMPKATREHYAKASGATIELVPHDKLLTWDNRKLALG